MPDRVARSRTAQLVSELIGTRHGRQYLQQHGWMPGMPVIMTGPREPLDDVMGLVSVHEGPSLVAMIDPISDQLRFLHVSLPTPVLQVVGLEAPGTIISSFFDRARRSGSVTFRVKYWPYSAVAHALPPRFAQPLVAPTAATTGAQMVEPQPFGASLSARS